MHKQIVYGYNPVRSALRSQLKRCSIWCKLYTPFSNLELVHKEIKKKRGIFVDNFLFLFDVFVLLFSCSICIFVS